MDTSAINLSQENKIPIIVFSIKQLGSFSRVLKARDTLPDYAIILGLSGNEFKDCISRATVYKMIFRYFVMGIWHVGKKYCRI